MTVDRLGIQIASINYFRLDSLILKLYRHLSDLLDNQFFQKSLNEFASKDSDFFLLLRLYEIPDNRALNFIAVMCFSVI